jgi:uncharacterized membrane protein YgcG
MRRKDKPFVLYRHGPMSFTLQPRGLSGWVQFALWLGLAVPLLIWFAELINAPAGDESARAAMFLVLFGMAAWAIAGLWWMCANAEEIDAAVHKRDQQRARQRARRSNGAGGYGSDGGYSGSDSSSSSSDASSDGGGGGD